MANLTLYRKYRPQSFSEIVNQEHVKDTIQQEILSGKLPHAFLFYGPRGVGKTTTARILAKSLNCTKRKEAEPCNKCESCEAMNSASSLNLVEVDAASQTGVDNVRENIIANARVAVKADTYKIFIIDEVHMLSTSSFNALLKTLEEPPERVLFILATTEIHKIPETIISRCQRFDFHTIQSDVLREYLGQIVKKEKREVEDAVLSAIVKKSGGYLRDALSVLGQVLTLPGKITTKSAELVLPISHDEDVIEFFELIKASDAAGAMKFIGRKEKEGFRPHHFTGGLIDFAHKMMLKSVGSHPDIFEGEVAKELLDRIEALSSGYTPGGLLNMIDVLLKRKQQLKNLDLGSLPLEMAVIELTSAVSAPPAQPTPIQQAQPVAPPKPAPAAPAPKQPAPKPAVKAAPPEPVEPEPLETVSVDEPTNSDLKIGAVQKNDSEAFESASSEQNLVSFSDLQRIWDPFLKGLNDDHHSLVIVLKTAEIRDSGDGSALLVFRYQMHHDHIKRCMHDLVEEAAKHLEGRKVGFKLTVDADLSAQVDSDVQEPKEEEKEALGSDLQDLAAAFGGSVMD